MKNTVLLFFSLSAFCASGQSITDYTPYADNTITTQNLSNAVKSRYEQDVASLNGSLRKQIVEIYKERYEYLAERIKANEVITNEAVQEYLGKILSEILHKNPALSNTQLLRVYFSRAWWANASSMGEGTILFNIGLFHRLDNEAQAAFVLCHELAHYYLNHGNNNIQQYVETVYSDAFQKRLKQISKSEYNKNSQLEQMALTLGFKNRRHSRQHEEAADSMAICLMKNTDYDLKEAITCLRILDSSDKEKFYMPLLLDKTFHFESYPFKKRWIESNTLMFAETREEKEKKEVLADSLKTHPDCSLRINRIETTITKINKTGQYFIVDAQKFAGLKQAFDYEILNYLFTINRVSLCLYTALQMQQSNLESPYVLGMIGKCLNQLYTAQKNHELGKIADLPGPGHDAEYNKLLKLIQNLRLPELAAINYYFLESQVEKGKTSEEFIAALITSKELFGKPEEKSRWTDYYNTHFTKRKYQF